MFNKLVMLVSGFVFCLCVGCATNPVTGEEQLMLISEEQDIEIGRKYAPEVERQMGGRIDNGSLQYYVDSVGQRVARVSHKPYFEYHFVAVEDKSVNAVALPGGYVFITKGILKKLTSEAQLAGILAHEITHIVARHTSANMSREIGVDILLSAVTSEQTSSGVLTAAELARQVVGIQYSRRDEQEADLGGMDYMVRAGYNPYGMVETMQMLEQENVIRPIEFLSTHPSPQNRRAYLTQKIQTSYYNIAGLKIGKEDYRRSVLEQLIN